MAKRAKKKEKKEKVKKEKKKKVKIKKGNYYKDGKKTRKACTKCGPAVMMAEHKNRYSCGTCGYTETKKTTEKNDPAN
jgi:ubiquitin-small subunit ribosomal protein S27Ae